MLRIRFILGIWHNPVNSSRPNVPLETTAESSELVRLQESPDQDTGRRELSIGSFQAWLLKDIFCGSWYYWV